MKEGVHTFSMQIKDANAMSWAILFSIIVAGLCGVHGLGGPWGLDIVVLWPHKAAPSHNQGPGIQTL